MRGDAEDLSRAVRCGGPVLGECGSWFGVSFSEVHEEEQGLYAGAGWWPLCRARGVRECVATRLINRWSSV